MKTTVNTGIGLPGLLTALFVGLKLTNNIDWSWWWVVSPLWIGAAIALASIASIVLMGLFVIVAALVRK